MREEVSQTEEKYLNLLNKAREEMGVDLNAKFSHKALISYVERFYGKELKALAKKWHVHDYEVGNRFLRDLREEFEE